jgi:hypothetical protein
MEETILSTFATIELWHVSRAQSVELDNCFDHQYKAYHCFLLVKFLKHNNICNKMQMLK